MAPKSKPAPANGAAAKGTAPSTNGTTTPVSTADKKDTSDATTVGRPDKKVFDAEQDKIKSSIDALQVKLNAVREKISLATGKSGPGNERRTALYAELDQIRGQQSNNKMSRDKMKEQMKTLRESTDKKVKDLQAAKSKLPFKTVAEVDAHIKQLERQVESGSMKLVDEKRALAEITAQKRNRRTIEGFQMEQDAIDKDRNSYDDLKKQLDDPEAMAASDRYDAIRAELDAMKKEGDEAHANRTVLFTERDALQAEINTLWNEKREASQKFRESNDRYWAKVNEDRARRAERLRAQRAAEELQKKQERAERIREEAEMPAFQAQIEDCQTLIDYFSGKSSGTVTFKTQSASLTTKADVAGVPKLEIRKVEAAPDGVVVRKKKGEEEDAYFIGAALNVPLATLSALLTLSIPPPASNADVPRVIEDLKTKKEWFEANQARVTAENIAKAEAEIKALNAAAKEAKLEETTANGGAASPSQVADSPAPAEDKVEVAAEEP
ncbi:Nuclear segregation protein bfr1 [Mycena venus]|uniref:Nuclear segregation protein bfr1 n=1 Tax=Mycena venus TaxID=2733690 RepID=A0A8H6Y5H9_9AGAR|nr:Nuclear segregation protein bfr1 [Mycena venus]